MSGLGDIWCTHSDTVRVGNEAICTKCHARFELALTEETFNRAVEAVYRAGYHSMGCVHTADGEWCCADDCPSRR